MPIAEIAPPHVNDITYVKACLETWARWCHGAVRGGISITGRLMQGIKSNVCPGWIDDVLAGRAHDAWCPHCGGTGRVKMKQILHTTARRCPLCDEQGLFLGQSCFRCHGTRTVTMRHIQINPATIRSTRHVGGQANTDTSTLIDALVAGWREHDQTYWLNRVIISEYHHNGTQEMKARRLRISRSWYCKNLADAHRRVERMLVAAGL
jgi:hypothetical protein